MSKSCSLKNRIGVSKVSGTVKGSVMAGIKIIGWIFKYTLRSLTKDKTITCYNFLISS
jgi:hypothetical protein